MARDYQGDTVCSCGRPLPVYLTGGGMLTTSCGWCRRQEHCPKGSRSYRELEAKIKPGDDPENSEPSSKTAEKPKTLPGGLPPGMPPTPPAKTAVKDTSEKTIFDIFNKDGQTA